MSNTIHTESTFESAIVAQLTAHGWQSENAFDFSKDLAFDKNAVLLFVQTSQPFEWERLKSYYKEEAEIKFIPAIHGEPPIETYEGIKRSLFGFRPLLLGNQSNFSGDFVFQQGKKQSEKSMRRHSCQTSLRGKFIK